MGYIVATSINYADPVLGRSRQIPAGCVAPKGVETDANIQSGAIVHESAWRGYAEKEAFEKRVAAIGTSSRKMAEQIVREEQEAVDRLTADNERRQAAGEEGSDPWLELICLTKHIQAGHPGTDFHDAYDRAVAEQAGNG